MRVPLAVIVIAAIQLISPPPIRAQPTGSSADAGIAFHNETCGTLTVTVERELPTQRVGSGPADSSASSPTICADSPDGCEVFAIDAGETEKTTPAPGAESQLIDVKIEGRCDQGPVTIISGHCVVALNQEDAGDSGYLPVMSALDEYYYAGADPAFDLTRRVGFRTGGPRISEMPASVGIALSDCGGDGVRQICAAACRPR